MAATGETARVTGDSDILKRLEELESQLAFQDELHAQLNDIVARQDREISLLGQQLAEVARRLKEVGEAVPGEPSDPAGDVPPHY
jgi:SlyX protein